MANTTNPTHAGVLLKHDTPDNAFHYDWLFENPTRPPTTGDLITFRAPTPISDWPDHQSIDLIRLPDHRRAYLDYQGPISHNRGHVTRIERFTLTAAHWSDTAAQLTLHREHETLSVRLQHNGDDRWSVFSLDA